MGVSVAANFVSVTGDALYQSGCALDDLADDKERGVHLVALEKIENGRRGGFDSRHALFGRGVPSHQLGVKVILDVYRQGRRVVLKAF